MFFCLRAQLPLNNNSSAELSLRAKVTIGYFGYIFVLCYAGSKIKVPGLFSAILILPFFLLCQNKRDDVIGLSLSVEIQTQKDYLFFFPEQTASRSCHNNFLH